jgi:L-fucose isomerase-like protein
MKKYESKRKKYKKKMQRRIMGSAVKKENENAVRSAERGVLIGKKPTLGIIAIAKKNHQKDEIYQFVNFLKERFGREASINLMLEETVLFDEYEIVSRVRRMEIEGADLIVLIVGTWIYSSIVVTAVNDLQVPFILYGLSDRIANGNLGASLQIRYVLEEMGKRFLYLCGPIQDEKSHQIILKYARAAWVRRYLRNRKIATIGGKCMMMYQTQVNEYCWKRVFGVDFPQYDTVQVFKEMENVSDEEARKVEKEFIKQVDEVHWQAGEDKMEEDAILTQAKMFLAFKRLQKLYDIDIFANKCMPEMSAIPYGYGYAGCLATCMLNEAGIITACEADVPAGLSMYILHLLSGGAAFFADIARLNKSDNRVTFFNCGTAPVSLADRKQGVHVWPMPGNIADEALPEEYFISKMKGGTIRFDLENDREVTLLRIGGNDETLRFHVATATTAPREVEPDEIIGNRWPGFGIRFKEDAELFLKNTTGHHYSIVYGNYVDELSYLAQILNIQFVYNH